MLVNNYQEKAKDYAKHEIQGTLVLAYNEFQNIISKYVKEGINTLDFGCGCGRSTRFLKSLGLNCVGVDIDENMIIEASKSDESGKYKLIKNGIIPEKDAKFDLVFLSLVLLEIPTKELMHSAMEELYRVSKLNSTIIILTVAEDFYTHNWISVDTNFPENRSPSSGDLVKVRIKEIDLVLNDYYWKKSDYRSVFEDAGFSIVNEFTPKANNKDNDIQWQDELIHSPYIIFTLKKKKVLINVNEFARNTGLNAISPHCGYFRETKRSSKMLSIYNEIFKTTALRNDQSEIELLLEVGQHSFFHKSTFRETFNYVDGRDMIIHIINTYGEYSKVLLGREDDNAVLKFSICPDTWFATEVIGEKGFSLATVASQPGFDPDDVKVATKDDLVNLVSHTTSEEVHDVINRLTWNSR